MRGGKRPGRSDRIEGSRDSASEAPALASGSGYTGMEKDRPVPWEPDIVPDSTGEDDTAPAQGHDDNDYAEVDTVKFIEVWSRDRLRRRDVYRLRRRK